MAGCSAGGIVLHQHMQIRRLTVSGVVNLKMILELADDECNSDRRAVFNSCDRLVL